MLVRRGDVGGSVLNHFSSGPLLLGSQTPCPPPSLPPRPNIHAGSDTMGGGGMGVAQVNGKVIHYTGIGKVGSGG